MRTKLLMMLAVIVMTAFFTIGGPTGPQETKAQGLVEYASIDTLVSIEVRCIGCIYVYGNSLSGWFWKKKCQACINKCEDLGGDVWKVTRECTVANSMKECNCNSIGTQHEARTSCTTTCD